MSILRRFDAPGSAFFVTCVTYNRIPVLVDLHMLITSTIERLTLDGTWIVDAWVILPDHLHLLVWPRGADLSTVMHRFKMIVGTNWRSTQPGRSGKLWQHRFWDHMIRDDEDYRRRVDYIHYNPVRHGKANDPFAYPSSSLGNWTKAGLYQPDWGVVASENEQNFGE